MTNSLNFKSVVASSDERSQAYIESLQQAQSTIDDFNTRYIGAYEVEPTEDINGNELVEGALYFNTSSGDLYAYSNQWEPAVGPQGVQGIQGEQGIQGIQGEQGEQGPQGEQGIQGEAGPQGIQGEVGPQGQSIQGERGLQGIQGIQGEVGPQGDTGPQGDQGPQGIQGEVGEQGPQGLQGDTGPQGPQGIQGDQGPQGIQGEQGIQGDASENLITNTNYTFVGVEAGGNVSGNIVTATGHRAAYDSIGDFVVATGENSCRDNVSTNVTAYGYESARFNSGDQAAAFGHSAGYFNSGNDSTFNGHFSGHSNTGDNVTASGSFSAIDNSGNNVIALGHNAANANSNDNVYLIGNDVSATGNNQVQLGGANDDVYAKSFNVRSDQRDKADIEDIPLGLDFLLTLNPVVYKWDRREFYRETVQEIDDDGNPSIRIIEHPRDGSRKRNRFHAGFIAQEVKTALDNAGQDLGLYQDHSIGGGEDTKSLDYLQVIPILVKAIQEANAKIEQLEQLVDQLN